MSIFKTKKKVLYNLGKVKTSEVGLQLVNWDELGGNSYNPDEIGLDTYKRMMKDSEIRSAFNLIKFSTLSRDWKIINAGKKGKGEEVVKFLRYAFEHMDGRIDGGLSNILFAVPYGFSVTEIVYKMFKEGEFKGKIGIKKMKGLDPETITFITDKFGNLKKVLQDTDQYGKDPIKLPIERLLIYTNEKEFGNYYGTPRLRSIYKSWFIKDVVTKFWNISLERFGMPMLIGKVPSSKDLTDMADVLSNAQAKSSISVVDGWEVNALETGIGRSAGGDYSSCIDYHNAQILKGMLVPGALMGSEAGGSFAKSRVSFDVFQLMLKSLEVDLCGMVEQYLIKPLIQYNFGEMDEYPQFVFEPLTKAEFLELSKVFALLVRNGVVGADETWMRDMMRVPKRSEMTGSRDGIGGGLEKVPVPETGGQVKTADGKAKEKSGARTAGKKTQQVKTPK